MKQIKIEQSSIGIRLDVFLLEHYFKDKSRNYIQQLIKDDHIKVNQLKVKTGYLLKEHDLISIEEVVPEKLQIDAVDLNLDIIYEDDDLLVINKPQGLVVHPASSYKEPTLVHGLLHQVDELSSINGVIRPGIVHRIDKDTSGLLVVAKNDETHRQLSDDLSRHEISRVYMALVYGKVDENEGTINAPIARHPKNRLKMAVLPDGKHAVTHFKVIERFDAYTLIECRLETGRTHQIRVHMQFIHHPIVGDPIYGPKEVIGQDGQFLHAIELSFYHPRKKEQMTFHAPLPNSFILMLEKLKSDSVS
ncbi:MAG: RluA family pseudouridine synthase [Acholeplasmataceae bacterium]|jgi:23S rRNA pseudouridine1911/1915/1917 synthase|nr:RluA family pseudouridine synthase [Acholeplasmataceae bacterium]